MRLQPTKEDVLKVVRANSDNWTSISVSFFEQRLDQRGKLTYEDINQDLEELVAPKATRDAVSNVWGPGKSQLETAEYYQGKTEVFALSGEFEPLKVTNKYNLMDAIQSQFYANGREKGINLTESDRHAFVSRFGEAQNISEVVDILAADGSLSAQEKNQYVQASFNALSPEQRNEADMTHKFSAFSTDTTQQRETYFSSEIRRVRSIRANRVAGSKAVPANADTGRRFDPHNAKAGTFIRENGTELRIDEGLDAEQQHGDVDDMAKFEDRKQQDGRVLSQDFDSNDSNEKANDLDVLSVPERPTAYQVGSGSEAPINRAERYLEENKGKTVENYVKFSQERAASSERFEKLASMQEAGEQREQQSGPTGGRFGGPANEFANEIRGSDELKP